jgi:lipopolysaccharide assembly outer membrane protein LptD (OstA)
MIRFRTFLVTTGLLLGAGLCLAPALLYGDGRLHLKRADVLENRTIDGQPVQILTGNVVFVKDEMTLTSDYARYRQKQGYGYLVGNVRATKGERQLDCDSLFYDAGQDLLKAFGRTHIYDQDYDLVADSLIYFSELDSGDALGHVRLTQQNQVIRADRITYIKRPGRDAVSYQALGNVTIREGERIATCGAAWYERDTETTVLRLDPELREGERLLSGLEINLYYRDEVLERIYIPDRAHAVVTSSGWQEQAAAGDTTIRRPVSFQDDMTGRTLVGFFRDGKLDSMRLEGMATTLYHLFEDSLYQGKNFASGDTVVMRFQAGELERIIIAGGARGTFTPDSANQDVTAPIVYRSAVIDYQLDDEVTDLYRDAAIHYTDVDLTAGFVNVNWQSNVLKALPVAPGDTTVDPLQPTLIERGREPMTGRTMLYNLKTGRGQVIQGRTRAEDGFYAGREIRNRENDIFYVRRSSFTTCELDTPHFHFSSRQMKLIRNDKVISRPLILYISEIPVIGLPFAIFPHQGGRRHSGWIMPTYGESRNRGQFLDGLGYYWAPNDYWDSKFLLSFADRQGVTFKVINRYNKRYGFRGNLYLETRQFLGFGERDITYLSRSRRTDYVVRWKHNQYLRGEQSLNADASYYSNGEYNRIMGLNPVRRLNQQAISNVTYSKSWRKLNLSLSMNLSSRRDLMAERKIDTTSVFYQIPKKAGTQLNITTSTLPSLTLRQPR